jgi:hypothetical protein
LEDTLATGMVPWMRHASGGVPISGALHGPENG